MTRFERWCDRNYLDPRWLREGFAILAGYAVLVCVVVAFGLRS